MYASFRTAFYLWDILCPMGNLFRHCPITSGPFHRKSGPLPTEGLSYAGWPDLVLSASASAAAAVAHAHLFQSYFTLTYSNTSISVSFFWSFLFPSSEIQESNETFLSWGFSSFKKFRLLGLNQQPISHLLLKIGNSKSSPALSTDIYIRCWVSVITSVKYFLVKFSNEYVYDVLKICCFLNITL